MNKMMWYLVLAIVFLVGYFKLIVWIVKKMNSKIKELYEEYKELKKEESLFEKEYNKFMHNKED